LADVSGAFVTDLAIDLVGVGRVFRQSARSTPLVALDDVSFSVGVGEVVGLLGSNGAGKTTLTKILSTLLLPTSGTAQVFGVDVVRNPREARRYQSVVLGGDRGLYNRLTARDNLRFFGMLDGLTRRELRERVPTALEEVGLSESADRAVDTFSKGMRQRLHIAIGMISRPRLLLLDEPTVGLDPVEAERLRRAIADLGTQGVSVLLTSHYLLDIEHLADRVVMLERGRVTHEMSVEAFTRAAGYAATVVVQGHGSPPALGGLTVVGDSLDSAGSMEVTRDGAEWTATLLVKRWSPEVFAELNAALDGVDVVDVEVRPARLEDAFVRLQMAAG
jgi:ABC-2 type transport system ATP-binding protein